MYFSFREGCDVTVIISLNERFLKYKPPQRLHQCTTAEPLRVSGRALIFKMTTRGTLVYRVGQKTGPQTHDHNSVKS